MLSTLQLALSSVAWTPRLLRLPTEGTSPWGGSLDMAAVLELQRTVGGEQGPAAALWLRERGFRSHVLAVSDTSDDAIGCAHLGRLAVGGFLVLKSDHLLSTVLVQPEVRRQGVGRGLVTELLHRLPRNACAWAVVDGTDSQACGFLAGCGGEARGSLKEVAQAEPLVAAALVVSGGALARGGADGARLYRFAGQSDALQEYSSDGRLSREAASAGGEVVPMRRVTAAAAHPGGASRRTAAAAAAAAAVLLSLSPVVQRASAKGCPSAQRLLSSREQLDLAVQASSVQAWPEALEVADDALLDATGLAKALDACDAARAEERRAVLSGVDELRALLRTLGERGRASNDEAMRAMRYGTAARSALDGYLSRVGLGDGAG